LKPGECWPENSGHINEELLRYYPIPDILIESVAAREWKELERRERIYRSARPAPDVRGRTVILVDDGIATGTTMRSAVEALKKLGADGVVIAVPVAPGSVCDEFQRLRNHVVFTCLTTPEMFFAISLWYEDFPQTTDEEVCHLLNRADAELTAAPAKSRSEAT